MEYTTVTVEIIFLKYRLGSAPHRVTNTGSF